LFWLESIKYIDLNFSEIILNCFYVGLSSKGAIKLDDMEKMTVKEYDMTIRQAIEICKKLGIIKEE
jgi:hypothetical protein